MLQVPIDDSEKRTFYSNLMALQQETTSFPYLLSVLKENATRIEKENRYCTDNKLMQQNNGALQFIYELIEESEQARERFGKLFNRKV